MKKLPYLFFLFISLSGYSQNLNDTIKSDIRNTKTEKHIVIPGTRLYMIPPPNFKLGNTILGLERDIYTGIIVMDLIGGNFDTNTATFAKETFEKKGAKVFDFREIRVNGYPAKYCLIQGDPYSKAFILVFGDTTFSTMIVANILATDNNVFRDIISSLNSIYYDKNRKIDPFETAQFSLSESGSKLKFNKFTAGMYIYSIDGKDINTDERDQDPFLMVMQLPKEGGLTLADVANTIISKGQENGFTDLTLISRSSEKINGYNALETVMSGQIKNKNSLLYYCVIEIGNRYITIMGVTKNNNEINLAEFKKLSHTIKIK